MFVVITLIADSRIPRTPANINAFGTPNVIHFLAVLLLAAILSAPWQRMQDPAHLIGLSGLAGVVYVLVVLRRMRRQTGYKIVLEDWVWHFTLPVIAYSTMFVCAMGLSHEQDWALFGLGGISLLLLGIGIHNAWDTVTYIVAAGRDEKES
jgi:hypothetical protein